MLEHLEALDTHRSISAIAFGYAPRRPRLRRASSPPADLMLQLYTVSRQRSFATTLDHPILGLKLLMIEEIGCLPFGPGRSQPVLPSRCESYELGSMVLTSNVPFVRWATTFADNAPVTAAMLDGSCITTTPRIQGVATGSRTSGRKQNSERARVEQFYCDRTRPKWVRFKPTLYSMPAAGAVDAQNSSRNGPLGQRATCAASLLPARRSRVLVQGRCGQPFLFAAGCRRPAAVPLSPAKIKWR